MEAWTFGWGDGTAIVIMRGYCEFELFEVTNNLITKIDTLKELIAEALMFCGNRMDGEASREMDKIPYVNFWPFDHSGVSHD